LELIAAGGLSAELPSAVDQTLTSALKLPSVTLAYSCRAQRARSDFDDLEILCSIYFGCFD
jgi:hypothetical protein